MKCIRLAKRCNAYVLSLMTLFFLSTGTWGTEIKVPLQFDYSLIRHILLTQVFTGPDNTARVWDDGKDCNSLVLWDPDIASDVGRIRIVNTAKAKVGAVVAGHCTEVLQWQGRIELFERPVVAPSHSAVQFEIVDSKLYDEEGNRSVVAGTVWDWTKTYVHRRLEAVKLDLDAPLREVRTMVPLMFPPEGSEAIKSSLDSMEITDVRADDQGLAITLKFNVPETQKPNTAQPPEPALTPDEAQIWEAAWQRWDAFLTFVIRQAASETELREVRQALLGILLDGRYDISEALTSWTPGTPDPVRQLFRKSWKRLTPVLRRLSTNLPGAELARYLSFIAAGDALESLDELGEQMGFKISADGLRQLARTLAPQYTGDPLIYGLDVDTELRQLFGFGQPLPLPETTPDVDPGAWIRLIVPEAWAAKGPDSSLVKRLNRWVPEHDEVDAYLPLVRDLLKQTANATIDANSSLDKKFRNVFPVLSFAVAWQESCWRQFVKDGGKLKPLTSKVGATGIMQVNPRIWRGFYDVRSLHGDIGYNAAAGDEILLHYLVDYVTAEGEHGSIDRLVQATYAVYNGGPGQIGRHIGEVGRAVLVKFQTLLKDELAVARCFEDNPY